MIKVKSDISGLLKLKENVRDADGKEGRAGYYDHDTHKKSGTPMSMVAYYNTMGSDGGHIPQRPFMQDGIEDSVLEVRQVLSGSWVSVLRGKSVNKPLIKSADKVAKWMSENIRNNSYVANRPSTLRKKSGDKPLMDTEQLVDSAKVNVFGKDE